MRCRWWNRWLHERKRNADVLYLLPALQLYAEDRATSPPGTDAHDREVEALVDAGFEMHKALPGQEHWHCACAAQWRWPSM
jgi:hypothetical protein